MSNKEQKTFREMFNQMADKHVHFGEYCDLWDMEIKNLSFLEKFRLYATDYPVGLYQALFVKDSEEQKRLDKTDMYYRSRSEGDTSLFGNLKDLIITKDWLVATDTKGVDLDATPSDFRTKIIESQIAAWNKAEDRSDEILKGNYRAQIHKSPR